MQINQPQIAVLGAGESGISAARLLMAEGVSVCVYDTAERAVLEQRVGELEKLGASVRCGSEPLGDLSRFSKAILSPGIDPSSRLVQAFLSSGIELMGELELAFERCQCPVVAITGTNGKTTTTQLIDSMFNAAGTPSVACGNIGPAFSAKVSQSRQLAVMTVEVSSFQLETVRTFKPKISVWLNFAPDHLDRYRSMDEYFDAKFRIFQNATSEDWAILNARDPLPEIKSRPLFFSAYKRCSDFELVEGAIWFRANRILKMTDTRLRGAHNAENLMAALGVGFAWGIHWENMLGALCEYRPLPHRCEVVGEIDGVEYVNDSKATNLDALEKALATESRRVVLIAGGKDKGFEFGSVAKLVAARCRGVVLIGEMADRIEGVWGEAIRCYKAADLSGAVSKAREIAEAGDVILFSPGTSSFDMFQNYADRGNQFRAAVKTLSSHSFQPT